MLPQGSDYGEGPIREEIALLRDEVAELERLYSKDGSATLRPVEPAGQHPLAGDRAVLSLRALLLNRVFQGAILAASALLALVVIAALFPAPLEEVAKTGAPDAFARAEWYFLSIVQLPKYFSGNLEMVAILGLPIVFGVFLLLLPFIDRNPSRSNKRYVPKLGMSLIVGVVLVLTVLAATERSPVSARASLVAPQPPKPAAVGAGLYATNCYNCHGFNFQPALDTLQFQKVVGEGIQAKGMPAFGSLLTDFEKNGLAAYVQSSRGAKLFAGFCAGCHGNSVDTAKDVQTLGGYITRGNPAKGMPAYGAMLTPIEITSLTDYISSGAGKGNPPPAQPAGAGSALYLRYCATCHGAKGDQIPKAELGSPNFRERHDEADILGAISNGTSEGMPSFAQGKGGNLTEQQISELASFLRFWEGMAGGSKPNNSSTP